MVIDIENDVEKLPVSCGKKYWYRGLEHVFVNCPPGCDWFMQMAISKQGQ